MKLVAYTVSDNVFGSLTAVLVVKHPLLEKTRSLSPLSV